MLSVCARVFVAQGLNPTAFPPLPRLATNLANMEGLLFGEFDVLANCVIRVVHVDAQPAEFFLHLQDFRISKERPVCCSTSATNGSKSRHSCHTMSSQPSQWVNPKDIVVC